MHMNIKRLIIWLSGVTALGIIILFMWNVVLHRRSVPIGDMEWIYLGNNMSEIRFRGKTLTGPCQMEIVETGDAVYGNSDEDTPWFVIDKKSHRILKGGRLYCVCRAMGVPYLDRKGFRFETFLTRRNTINK